MKIHKCYFCNYATPKRGNLFNHVTKQNKCSYLIKSLTINSLDDYYNLRDLHKNNPDHHIFGEDDENQPPPQYYDSDDESITDDEKKTAIDNNTKYIEDKINTYLNQVYNCEYCNKEFNRKDSLKRHYNSCKVIKQIQKEEQKIQNEEENRIKIERAEAKYNQTMKDLEDKELVEQILLLKSLMDQQNKENEEKNRLMQEKIKQLEKNPYNNSITTNSNNITNNNTQINNINKQENNQVQNQIINNTKNQITINTFGNENKDIFQDENHMLAWIKAPFNAIPNMIEKLHFTPTKRPENTNIRINNISNGKAQIYKNDQWKTVMKHELIYDLITECVNKLIDTYEIYVEEGKIQRMQRFEKFMKQYEKDDAYFVKTQTEKVDCRLIDLQKKHKLYLNSLG